MDSPTKELSSTTTPREVDLFAEEALEEVFETIDSLRAQFDQLQIHCEKLAAEKAKVDQLLIDKETEYQHTKEQLQEDISSLRKVNLQLLASQKASSKDSLDLGSFVIDSEKVYQEKVEAEAKVDALQLTLLEKDKYISSLEWQLVDAEAAIASIQAERDRLGLELDCALGREQDDLHSLGAVGDTTSNDPLEHLEYGLVESGYVDDMPVKRHRKQPRRHLSDLTTRGNSHIDDFGAVFIANASLSDYDVPTLAEKEYNGLGSLRRANNFSDINNLDEHQAFDRRQSEATVSSVELHGKWESFDESDGPGLNKNKFGDVSGVSKKINGGEDMWTFTPDSIINVSTGEELSSIPPSPNDIQKLSEDSSEKPENSTLENNVDYLVVGETGVVTKSPSAERSSSDTQSVVHNNSTSVPDIGTRQVKTSRSSSVVNAQNYSPKKITRRSASDAGTNMRLQEYHKWKVSGCKGDPPAKLKISQC